MSLSEIRDHADRWSREGRPWAEALLIRVQRSAPRPPGARFAASADGETAGSISAGCVEADLLEHMMEVLESGVARVVQYGITDDMAVGVGLSCGGEIEVLIRPHAADDPVWPELEGVLRSGGAAALLTGVSPDLAGHRMLVLPDGTVFGGLGAPELERSLADPEAAMLAREGGRILELAGNREVFLDALVPARRIVIVGAGPVAATLARMAAMVEYRVTVVDPREALTRAYDFGDALVVHEWPDAALPRLELDPWTDVAVLAHDPRLDVPALTAALRANCRYIGLLGGSRTQRLRRDALVDLGLAAADIARIRGPIGLELNALTPAEIAVAVLAEMLACRRGGRVVER